MVRFVVYLVLVTFVVCGAVLWLTHLDPSFFYETSTLLFLGTLAIVYLVLKSYSWFGTLIQSYLASILFKLVVYGVYLFFVIRKDPEHAGANAIFFGILYVVYTILEIGFLYRKVSSGRPRIGVK